MSLLSHEKKAVYQRVLSGCTQIGWIEEKKSEKLPALTVTIPPSQEKRRVTAKK